MPALLASRACPSAVRAAAAPVLNYAMRDPGLPVVLSVWALAAALLLGAPFLYNAAFPGAHFWTWFAVSVGGFLLILGALGACYLIWDWFRGRGEKQEKAEGERHGNEPPSRLCDLVAVDGAIRWDRGQPGGPLRAKYLVVNIENTSKRDLVNARLRLETIEQWLPQSNSWYPPEWFSPLFLVISFNDGGGDKTTIGAGESRTWDLVCYESESDTHVKILAAQPELRTPNQIRFGKWRVLCRFAADNCGTCDIEGAFDWDYTDVIPGRILNFEGPVTKAAGRC